MHFSGGAFAQFNTLRGKLEACVLGMPSPHFHRYVWVLVVAIIGLPRDFSGSVI